ncbi:MAG TPA: hypothetical protein VKE51_21295 [Vicinamibacterales bacterium]|nr:hypothetical protein [Vicinamibacterales bacterium]
MPLKEWDSFYVIAGSSAAALTGLMFVVIALVADARANLHSATSREIDAFGTPTVVHFSAVLMQSIILSAPWPTFTGARVALGIYAWAAIVYMVIVVRRTTRQVEYQPVLEDWLFHAVLPLIAYVSVAAAATMLTRHPTLLMFVVGGAAVLLMFVGIHNAWDTVTYIVLSQWENRRRGADAGAEKEGGAS